MNELQLIVKDNWKGIPNRNNRQNKTRKIYSWKLERFSHNVKVDFEIDFFPSSSAIRGIQLLKNDILKEINSKNIFDFHYEPMERDFLSIKNLKDPEEYLWLIFLNGNWIEEKYLYSERNYTDKYDEVENGFVEIK